jgi:molybdate transport system substrate-binding protein
VSRRSRPAASTLAALTAIGWLMIAGCGGMANGPAGGELHALAAASLREALIELAARYQEERGIELVSAFDASSTLRIQIEQGAPGDVFLAADEEEPARLAQADLTRGAPVPFAATELALIVPAGNPASIERWQDLARPGTRIVAAGVEVPLQRYADKTVARLAALPGAPVAFAEAVAGNVVSREDNARAVAARVELGEGDAALVYATDALAAEGVERIALPAEANAAVRYVAVVLSGSHRQADARAFLDWLGGAEARRVLERRGLRAP